MNRVFCCNCCEIETEREGGRDCVRACVNLFLCNLCVCVCMCNVFVCMFVCVCICVCMYVRARGCTEALILNAQSLKFWPAVSKDQPNPFFLICFWSNGIGKRDWKMRMREIDQITVVKKCGFKILPETFYNVDPLTEQVNNVLCMYFHGNVPSADNIF